MYGIDLHEALMPPNPKTIPFTPHFVAQFLGGLGITAKTVPTVMSGSFPTMQRGTDIGPGIGHVAPNILFPILVLGSGSISEFGSFTVLTKNSPIATAIVPSPPFIPIGINYNLNCGFPVPTPTGVVIAPNTVVAGMTLGDIFASACTMVVDIAVQGAMNFVWGRFTNLGVFSGTVGRVIIGNTIALFAGWVTLGSPVGYSAGWTPFGGDRPYSYPTLRDRGSAHVAEKTDRAVSRVTEWASEIF